MYKTIRGYALITKSNSTLFFNATYILTRPAQQVIRFTVTEVNTNFQAFNVSSHTVLSFEVFKDFVSSSNESYYGVVSGHRWFFGESIENSTLTSFVFFTQWGPINVLGAFFGAEGAMAITGGAGGALGTGPYLLSSAKGQVTYNFKTASEIEWTFYLIVDSNTTNATNTEILTFFEVKENDFFLTPSGSNAFWGRLDLWDNPLFDNLNDTLSASQSIGTKVYTWLANELTVTFVLPGGDITIHGVDLNEFEGIAITGGTGIYANARGEVILLQPSFEQIIVAYTLILIVDKTQTNTTTPIPTPAPSSFNCSSITNPALSGNDFLCLTKVNHTVAANECANLGTSLFALTSSNVNTIQNTVSSSQTKLWIGSWNGDTYNNTCLVLQGTSVTSQSCSQKLEFLCGS